MADNVEAASGSGGPNFATAEISWSGDTVHATGAFLGLLTGSEGSWTYSSLVGGAGAVAAGVLRTTLASDDPAVALLTAMDADTSGIATSMAILDDWDESDRAKVNLIVGQAGIAAGAGAVGVTVPRVTLASDDPGVALLTTIDGDTGSMATLLGTIDADTSVLAGLVLATQADDVANTADGLQTTSFGYMFDGTTWDRVRGTSTDGLLVNLGSNNDVTVTGTVTVGSHAVTNAGTFLVQENGGALTALQLLDNVIGTEDSAVPANVALVGGRYDSSSRTLETGDIGAVALNASGHMLVEISAGAGSGGTAAADDADFTDGTTSGTPGMGVYESTPTTVTDGDLGVFGITESRALKVALFKADGTEATYINAIDDADFTAGTTVGIPTMGVYESSPTSVTDGDMGMVGITETRALKVAIVSGAGSGGTASADDADFTAGTTSGTPSMGVYESSPTSVTDGDLGTVGITQTRALRVSVDAGTVTANLGAVDNAVLDTIDAVLDTINAKLVTGTVIGDVNLGATDNAVLDAIAADGDAIQTLLGTIDADTSGIITAVQLIDDAIFADDAAYTLGTSKGVMIMGFAGTQSVNANDAAALACETDGALHIHDGGNTITVDGTVAVTGVATAANQSTIIGHVDGIEGLLTTIDADTGSILTATQLLDNIVVAHDAAISGATGVAVIGLNARSAEPTAVGTADATQALGSLLGKQVTLDYAIPPSTWLYAAASGGITNTTGVTAKAAAGSGIRNYITGVQAINGHATVSTDVQIRDGASGTVLWRGFAQAAGGGCAAQFNPPLRGTANTLVEVACGTTGTATYINLQGFVAAE